MFDWIVGWVEEGGYVTIALLMLLENVFPPIPSELIMPLAGFSAAKGDLNIVGVVAAGTAGSLAGAFFWFWIGRAIGAERLKTFAGRHGRWLTLNPDEIDRARAVFERGAGRGRRLGRGRGRARARTVTFSVATSWRPRCDTPGPAVARPGAGDPRLIGSTVRVWAMSTTSHRDRVAAPRLAPGCGATRPSCR